MPAKVSVVIRTLNEAKHLENLLKGIHRQNYTDWEIVLVDSGSTDGTLDLADRYGARIFHIPKEEFTFGRSLNIGCREARGDYLVFASGHVWPITNNWLRNLVKPFEESSVAMVYGRQRGTNANRLSEIRDLQMQFGPVSHILVDEPKGNNGNAAIRRDLWFSQPFDESLTGLEDVDWAHKAERKNFRVYYAADASVYHVHEETLPQVFHRYHREAVAIKRMFPHNQFKWSDIAKGLPYFITGDILYAFGKGQLRRIFQIPATRIAQFLGRYRGMRHYKRHNRDLFRRLEAPVSCRRVVVDGPCQHGLQEADVPMLRADEALVKVAYVGVCPRDEERANGPSAGTDQTTAKPQVPGHEFSAVVVDVGTRADGLRKGDIVAGHAGLESGSLAGAYADHMAVPTRYLHRLPPDVPLKYGALVDTVAACVKGLAMLPVQRGQNVCVAGAGSLGNVCAQLLWAKGFRVTIVDSDPRLVSLIYRYEIDTLTELPDLEQYDVLVDTSTNQQAISQFIEQSRASATVLALGLPCDSPVEQRVVGPNGGPAVVRSWGPGNKDDWREAIGLMRAGTVRLDDHISEVLPLKAYREAWSSMAEREHIKVLLSASEELGTL